MLPREIVKLDPLVGDAACHTRPSVFLKLQRESELSEFDNKYLKDCELLTNIVDRKKDEFDIIIQERSDIQKIKVGKLKERSNKKINEKIGKKRKKVAEYTLKSMEEMCKGLQKEDMNKFGLQTINDAGSNVPVLSLYLSAKMMLYAAAINLTPITVYLKRIKSTEGSYTLDGCEILNYRCVDKLRFVEEKESRDDEEGIAIEVVSCVVGETEAEVGGFLMQSDYDSFLNSFRSLDIAALIMVAAVGHDQYPFKAKVNQNDFRVEEMQNDGGLSVDINKASKKEYDQLYQYARTFGMFREKSRYYYKNADNTFSRTESSLPFFIDHVYIASRQSLRNKCDELSRKCGKQTFTKEIKLELGK